MAEFVQWVAGIIILIGVVLSILVLLGMWLITYALAEILMNWFVLHVLDKDYNPSNIPVYMKIGTIIVAILLNMIIIFVPYAVSAVMLDIPYVGQ